ncbi:MAG: hypothetical protein RQ801_00255 [Spirochaetaceae bacterium]|nr:hypothetical protein [Spirochaetaceae bacterium]MDT8296700.1 hypothetical protein [Spirochaetaceae bacterium]
MKNAKFISFMYIIAVFSAVLLPAVADEIPDAYELDDIIWVPQT